MASLARIVALAAAMLTFTRAVADPTEGAPHAVVDAVTQDFGLVERGSVLSGTFVIDNVGSAPLTIDNIEFSSPGISARVTQTIAPASAAELVVDWDTADYTRGDAEAQISLQLNDPASPQVVLSLSCFVESSVEIDQLPAIDLGESVDETTSQTVAPPVTVSADIPRDDPKRMLERLK